MNTNPNIMQLMGMLQGGKMNPNAMVNMMISQNPQLKGAWDMANKMTQGKNPQQIQQVAQNLCNQNGIDINQIQNMLGGFNK